MFLWFTVFISISLCSKHDVLWMAPFFSRSGYGTEAIAFIKGLAEREPNRVAIRHHGDLMDPYVIQGFSSKDKRLLSNVYDHKLSEPGAWYPANYETTRCPPPSELDEIDLDLNIVQNSNNKEYSNKGSIFNIGRTMFETNQIPGGWVDRCNNMDQIWIPTKFHYDIFLNAGVEKSKLIIVPEAVEVDFYNPEKFTKFKLTEIGIRKNNEFIHDTTFIFLSIFKWEERKGWKILVEAFIREFEESDDVALLILTHGYHAKEDDLSPIDQINSYLLENCPEYENKKNLLNKIHIIENHIPTHKLPKLYKLANCFVLPSRGEGWGRPHVEAMSMSLPIIATNWSGPTEFMTSDNSYPLMIEKELVKVGGEGPFFDHLWANPSIDHLMDLLRHCSENREEISMKGKQARKDMIEFYHPVVIAKKLMEIFHNIDELIDSRDQKSSEEKDEVK